MRKSLGHRNRALQDMECRDQGALRGAEHQQKQQIPLQQEQKNKDYKEKNNEIYSNQKPAGGAAAPLTHPPTRLTCISERKPRKPVSGRHLSFVLAIVCHRLVVPCSCVDPSWLWKSQWLLPVLPAPMSHTPFICEFAIHMIFYTWNLRPAFEIKYRIRPLTVPDPTHHVRHARICQDRGRPVASLSCTPFISDVTDVRKCPWQLRLLMVSIHSRRRSNRSRNDYPERSRQRGQDLSA